MTAPRVILAGPDGKDYQYIDSWDVQDAQLSQMAANYNPLGATDVRGCANCQWFLSPGRCVVVSGEIAPTGNSDLWMAKVPDTQTPILVQIVKGTAKPDLECFLDDGEPVSVAPASGGLLSGLRELVTKFSHLGSATHPPVRSGGGLRLIKQKDGATRFFTLWSNNFEDREKEIFTAAAHKEFVDWATETGEYPELWLWHTKGSKFGQVDWLDVSDGFVCASGLIEAGKEAIAEKLAEEGAGVSHGFFGLQSANLIHWYRSYELSVLPLSNAAVWTTSFNLLNSGKDTEMAFTAQKRAFFNGLGIPEEQIKSWEAQTETLQQTLKDLGVANKSADLGLEEPVAPTPVAVVEATAAPVTADKAKDDAAELAFRTEMLTAVQSLSSVVAGLAGSVKEIDDRTKNIKSADSVIASAMTPAAATAVQASKSADNVVVPDSGSALDDRTREFFHNTVLGGFLNGNTPATAR